MLPNVQRNVACVTTYFCEEERDVERDEMISEDQIYENYKAVLDSKSTDETLVSFHFLLFLKNKTLKIIQLRILFI